MKDEKLTIIQQKLGQSPGSILYTGIAHESSVNITQWMYNEQSITEEKVKAIQSQKIEKGAKQWLHIEGVHDIDILKKIGEEYQIHNLFMEDVANVEKRPGVEFIEPYISITLKYFSFDKNTLLQTHSVTCITDGTRLISFCESGQGRWIDPIIKRLQNKQNSIRSKSAYYLLYALIDVLMDQCFVILEELSEQIELLDKNITQDTSSQQLDELYILKKEFLLFRKHTAIIPELIRTIQDELEEAHWKNVEIYFQDLLSHTIHIQESSKNHLESLSSMFDLYFSLLSLKMNRTIQTLTIITIVFLPLSLLTGIYGMNFIVMPGAENPNGFWILSVVMVMIVFGILLWFKKQRWF